MRRYHQPARAIMCPFPTRLLQMAKSIARRVCPASRRRSAANLPPATLSQLAALAFDLGTYLLNKITGVPSHVHSFAISEEMVAEVMMIAST
jgi:hypothetical protein